MSKQILKHKLKETNRNKYMDSLVRQKISEDDKNGGYYGITKYNQCDNCCLVAEVVASFHMAETIFVFSNPKS